MKTMSGKDLARLLERNGWISMRINGSHHIYGKPGSIVRISVPIHGNRPLKMGLQKHLLKMAGLSARGRRTAYPDLIRSVFNSFRHSVLNRLASSAVVVWECLWTAGLRISLAA